MVRFNIFIVHNYNNSIVFDINLYMTLTFLPPSYRSRRRHVGVACLDGCLYAVGGHDGTQHLNTVECYSQKVWQWVWSLYVLIVVGVVTVW